VGFAFFFKLDGDAGCDPPDTQTTHSQGLAALANVSAHELSEARTDPATPGGWYDSQGQEDGDKCAWTFSVPYVTIWKLQGEWSNNRLQPPDRLPEPQRAKGTGRISRGSSATRTLTLASRICPALSAYVYLWSRHRRRSDLTWREQGFC
jgi:hypothetical protein